MTFFNNYLKKAQELLSLPINEAAANLDKMGAAERELVVAQFSKAMALSGGAE